MNRINNRQDKGITLIALVVTIVVLIILAGITLNAVIRGGRNNLPSKRYKEPNQQRNSL